MPQPALTQSAPTPEVFRLPARGGDPYFSLSRTYYYVGDKLGYWQLVRLRPRGKQRGITLVPYDAVKSHIAKQREEQAKEKAAADAAKQEGATRK